MKQSLTLERHAVALARFDAFLDELASKVRPVQVTYTGEPMMQAREGEEDELRQLKLRGSALAGPASSALGFAGEFLDYRPAPASGRSPMRLNVAMNWETVFEEDPMFSLDSLRGDVKRVRGQLEAQLEAARAAESTTAGRVARALRFPIDVRDQLGLPPTSAAGRAVVGTGYVVSALLTVATGVAATGVASWLGWG